MVETSFEVPARGCVIVPVEWEANLNVRNPLKIQCRTPDGKVVNTVGVVERMYGTNGVRLALLLPMEVKKQDVPAGSEIWLIGQEKV